MSLLETALKRPAAFASFVAIEPEVFVYRGAASPGTASTESDVV